MARRYLGLSAGEWAALPWHVRRAYLEGMEQDESVPLTFERDTPDASDAGVLAGLPDGFAPQVRAAAPESLIDITGMLSDLEASRHAGR